MNKASVEQSLHNISKVFSKKILSTNFVLNGDVISWYNYKPGIIKGVTYAREYQLNLDSRQYSFLFADNSFFQFYFEFGESKLLKCKMAYYPVPILIKEKVEDLQEYEREANPWLSDVYFEMMSDMEFNASQISSNSHIRFDFDSKVKSHSPAHLQFGGVNDFRITTQSIILPFSFVEKILADFQPSWFDTDLDRANMETERKHGVQKCFRFSDLDSFYIKS